MLLATTREKPRRAASARRVDGVAGAGDGARPSGSSSASSIARSKRPASRRSAAACARKKCAARTGCARRRCVYDGISAPRRTRSACVGERGDQAARAVAAERDAALAGTAAGRATPARCATGRCAGACPPRRCARRAGARRTSGRPRPARRRTRDRGGPRRGCRASAAGDGGGVSGREHAGARERLRPREAARHVVFEQAPVEAERHAELEDRRRRAPRRSGRTRDAPSDRLLAVRGAGSPAPRVRAAVSTGRPQILMKPAAAPWSKRVALVVGGQGRGRTGRSGDVRPTTCAAPLKSLQPDRRRSRAPAPWRRTRRSPRARA